MKLEVVVHEDHPFCKDCLKGYEGGPYSARWSVVDETSRLVLTFDACPEGRADELRAFLSAPRSPDDHDHGWASRADATKAAQDTYAALDRWLEASAAAGRLKIPLEVARQRARVALGSTIHQLLQETTDDPDAV